jgi:hypothetical protein
MFRILLIVMAFTGAAHAFSRKADQPGPDARTAWIYKPDGGQSCSPQSGESLEDAAQALKKARIPVLDSRKASDGKMHIQMCGAATGSRNAYEIPRERLPHAIALGFQEAKTGQN